MTSRGRPGDILVAVNSRGSWREGMTKAEASLTMSSPPPTAAARAETDSAAADLSQRIDRLRDQVQARQQELARETALDQSRRLDDAARPMAEEERRRQEERRRRGPHRGCNQRPRVSY